MRISARADYAVRAAIELAGASRAEPVKGEAVATAQSIPARFLENILSDLKRHGIVASQRGAEGGYWLARPAADITVADVIRAVEGPLAAVQGERPENLDYRGKAAPLQRLWVSLRASLRHVLEGVSIADLAAGRIDPAIDALADDPDAWRPR